VWLIGRKGVAAFVFLCDLLIYLHICEFQINSRGMLCPFKAVASCFHPFGLEVLFRSKSFIKSTAWVSGRVLFFTISSPFSLQRICGIKLICFKRREARDFIVFGTVSTTMNSRLSDSFTDCFAADSCVSLTLATMLGLNKVCLSPCNISLSGIERVFLSMYSFNCLGSIKIIFFSNLSEVLYADDVPELCGISSFSPDFFRISDTTSLVSVRPCSWLCSEEEMTLSFSSTLRRLLHLLLTHLHDVLPSYIILTFLNLNPSCIRWVTSFSTVIFSIIIWDS